MKNIILGAIFLTVATVSIFDKNTKNIYVEKCIDCDSISKELDNLNNLYAFENEKIVKKTIKKVKKLDSTNKKINTDLKYTKNELIETKIVLSESQKKNNFLKKKLNEKPKEIVIIDTIFIKEKKNFWGSKKTDTIN